MAPKRTHYSDEENDTDEERVVKKPSAKKCKPVKKVAVWKDIKKWNEGDDPLGRFPIEVLNLCVLLSGFKKGGGRGGRKRERKMPKSRSSSKRPKRLTRSMSQHTRLLLLLIRLWRHLLE